MISHFLNFKRRPHHRVYKGGGGSSTTTTSIPNELKPLAEAYTDRALSLSNTPYTPYTDQRFADQNQLQTDAYNNLQGLANGQGGMSDSSSAMLDQIASGQGNNPYLDQLVANAQRSVTDAYNNNVAPNQTTAAVNSGSFGNSGLQQAAAYDQNQLQQNLGNIATQMYGNAYNTNQANALSAAGLQQQGAANQANLNNALLNAGNNQYAQNQQQYDFNYDQWTDAQNQPYKNLDVLGAPFSMNLGSVTKTSGGGK